MSTNTNIANADDVALASSGFMPPCLSTTHRYICALSYSTAGLHADAVVCAVHAYDVEMSCDASRIRSASLGIYMMHNKNLDLDRTKQNKKNQLRACFMELKSVTV